MISTYVAFMDYLIVSQFLLTLSKVAFNGAVKFHSHTSKPVHFKLSHP